MRSRFRYFFVRWVVCAFSLIGGFPLFAQSSGTLLGTLTSQSDGQPLEFATVRVMYPSDSTLVAGTVTDVEGNFRLQVQEGNFLVQFQFITFEPFSLEITIQSGELKDLGLITLKPSSLELEEVVVSGERSQLELKLDKKVYNVGKDLSNRGGSAADILENLPSVTLDVDGNAELRGSSNVQVLIDGKPSGLLGLSGSAALRQFQGDLIERVEIITNPSARYNASGGAGIINLVLKKERKKGLNGNFQANTGAPHNHGLSANVNFRRRWINFFVGYGLYFQRFPGQANASQQFTLQDTAYNTFRDRSFTRRNLTNTLRFGSDFSIGEKNTLTTSFLYRFSDHLNEAGISFRDVDLANNPINFTLRDDDEREDSENQQYALDYRRSFEHEEQELVVRVQYQDNHEFERSSIIQSDQFASSMPRAELRQSVRNDEGERRWLVKADYVHPLQNKLRFETGFLGTFRHVINDYRVDEADESGIFQPLDTFTTDFSYDERVYAVYGLLGKEHKALSWQVGIRMEATRLLSDLETIDQRFRRSFTDFFPSASFTYHINNRYQAQLSYSRRIRRPRFRQLNPLSSFTDNRNFRAGNPNLLPQYTDSYEMGILMNVANTSLYGGVYHRSTSQVIRRISLEPNERGERVRIPENIGNSNAWGLEANATHEWTDWYRIQGNVNFFHNRTEGMVGDSVDLSARVLTFSGRLSQSFKWKRVMDLQVDINYRAPRETTQGRRLAITTLSLGASREVLNKNGTLSVSLKDVFNSRRWRGETNLETLIERNEFQWRKGPLFTVTLAYRLNQSKRKDRGTGGRVEVDDSDF